MKIQAVIFDLDGVITDTASLHFKAWKTMFDKFLQEFVKHDFKEFTRSDYLQFVDGMPRMTGIENFLASRSIDLGKGTEQDDFSDKTLSGLANYKNKIFNQLLDQEGVEIFQSSVDLIKQLKKNNIKTAVASSSKNCLQVLKRAGIEDLFEARVDGLVLKEKNLRGKPYPGLFLLAAEQLNVKPNQAVVIEDAVCGVKAAARGKFSLIIGIDRHQKVKQQMLKEGADIIVNDLAEITCEEIINYKIQAKANAINEFDFFIKKIS